MAKYSIQLRNLIELVGEETVKSWFSDYELSDYLTAEEIAVINERGTWTKEKLAQMIVDHYYIYEIGFETPALFKHQAKVAMREIMEEKAPLIYSAAIKYDPLVNVDYTESFDRTSSSEGQSNSTSTTGTSGLSVNSDTPQGMISKDAILAGNFASSTGANETESNISDTSSNTGSGAEQYTKRVKGNSGVSATAQKMIAQYRDNIRAIDREIINKLEDLFMVIY